MVILLGSIQDLSWIYWIWAVWSKD